MSLEPVYLLTVFVVALCAGAGWSVGVFVVGAVQVVFSRKSAK